MAASGYRHTCKYVANPSTAMHHAEALPPLKILVNAEHFPASVSGPWVGKYKKGTPWTVPELLKEGLILSHGMAGGVYSNFQNFADHVL
jgi:hypothetical protein